MPTMDSITQSYLIFVILAAESEERGRFHRRREAKKNHEENRSYHGNKG